MSTNTAVLDTLTDKYPVPAWATDTDSPENHDGEFSRVNHVYLYNSTDRQRRPAIVAVEQWETLGETPTKPYIDVWVKDLCTNQEITPEMAREMGTALIKAADLLEQITESGDTK